VKAKVIIRSDIQKRVACDAINALEADQANPKWVVLIDNVESIRTKEQNALIWKLCSHFAMHTSYFGVNLGKEGWYYAFSQAFLDPIQTFDLKTGEMKFVPRGMSGLSKKDFSRVIDSIYEYAREKDFPLPNPEEWHD
jgi:hypothetical protein